MTANPLSPSPVMVNSVPASSISTRFTPLDPVRVLRQYMTRLIGMLVLGIVLGLVLFFVLKFAWPQYTSQAQLLVTGSLTHAYEEPSVGGSPKQQRLDVLRAFIKNQVIMIKSDDVIEAAIKKPALRETRWFRHFGTDVQKAKETLRENFFANQIIGSTLIQLKLRGNQSQDLQLVLNSIIEAYRDQYENRKRTDTSNVRKVFVRERDKAEDEYQNIQQQLKQFREEHDLATLHTANDEANLTYNELASQASVIAVNLQTSREVYRALKAAHAEGRIAIGPDALAKVEADPAISGRDERLRVLREKRDVFMHRFGKDHRAVLEVDRTIAATEVERKREVDNLLRERQAVALDQSQKAVATYEGQIIGMQPALEESRARLRDLTETLTEYNVIEAKSKSIIARRNKAQKLLDDMAIRDSRPDSAGVTNHLAATTPRLTFPTQAGVIVTTVVLLEAFFLLFIFVKELLDQRVKSPSDVMLIPHATVLGVLPLASEDELGPREIENVVQKDPTGLMAESFRQVRTAILTAAERSGHCAIMLVGPQPESGTSSVVNNLALSLAHDGRKVLVVDTNFRRPVQHRLFGVRGSTGLAEVLRGTSTLDNAIMHMVDPSVDVLTAGGSSAVAPELFEGRAFQQMLDDCRARYDVILIDAPPALLTSEAQILSKHVDAVAVVVRAARDQRGMVSRMLRMLDGNAAVMLGIILNAVESSAGGYFRKNYEAFRQYRQNGSLDAVAYQDDVKSSLLTSDSITDLKGSPSDEDDEDRKV